MIGQFSLFDIAPTCEGIDLRKVGKAYSADTIALTGTVRKPVLHGGCLWVNTGGSCCKGQSTRELYRLTPAREFAGESLTYNEKSGFWREGDKYPGDFARNDPNGFYHGMKVKHGGTAYVLTGPPQEVCGSYADFESIDAREDAEDEEDGEGPGLYDDEEDGGRTRIGNTPDDEDEYDEDSEDEQEPGEDVECYCGETVSRSDPYYATPCGTHCAECMASHVKDCGVCAGEFGDEFAGAA